MRTGVWIVSCLFLVCMFSACGGGGSGGSSSGDSMGTLSLSLTDSPTEGIRAIYVTIDRVEVHVADDEEGYWEVVADPDKTYNLLELVDGVLEHLGAADLPTGSYTQMRLIIGLTPDGEVNVDGNAHQYGNYLLFEGDTTQFELKVPSGIRTGIKLVHPFEIVEGLTVDLVLDFDAQKSIVTAGSSGQYLLKPTIKVIDTLDNATITGTVLDTSATPIPSVRVTAQTNDGSSASVESGTQTDEFGNYTMYVEPGTYCVVAYKPPDEPYGPAYGPGCEPTDPLDYYDTSQLDFEFTAVDTGNIIGNVKTDDTNDVILSFQIVGCNSAPCDLIEVWPLTIAAEAGSYTYTVGLPPGDYEVAANSGSAATQVVPATVTASTDTTGINFDFSSP
jgi:hypothetical protein